MSELTEKLETMGEEEVAQLYKKVFGSVEGQLIREDLRNRCFGKMTPFAASDPVTNFNVGMQSVVMHISTQINYKPVEREEEKNETN